MAHHDHWGAADSSESARATIAHMRQEVIISSLGLLELALQGGAMPLTACLKLGHHGGEFGLKCGTGFLHGRVSR